MLNDKREEIEWVKQGDYFVTSLIVWNDLYIPYQTIIFKKKSLLCRTFIKIDEVVYHEGFMVSDLRTDEDDEILFSITNYLQKLVNIFTLEQFTDSDKKLLDTEDNSFGDIKEILQEIFHSKLVMESLLFAAPDFGFYSLSANFHKLKMMIEEGRKPTIDEEFERLRKKYNQE